MKITINYKKSAVLLIVHGSSDLSADRTFSDFFYAELKEKFPDCMVYQAYSAPKTLRRIDREKAETPVNAVPEVMEQILSDGVNNLLVFAVNLNPCKKYFRVVDMIEPYRESFSSLEITKPLLDHGVDPAPFAGALSDIICGIISNDPEPDPDMVVLAAHTANEEICALWQPVLEQLRALCPYPVRLVFHNGKPGWADLIEELSGESDRKKILLLPAMLFGGRHLQKDILAEEGSLCANLRAAGHNVTVSPHGLGEYAAIRVLFYSSSRNTFSMSRPFSSVDFSFS